MNFNLFIALMTCVTADINDQVAEIRFRNDSYVIIHTHILFIYIYIYIYILYTHIYIWSHATLHPACGTVITAQPPAEQYYSARVSFNT